MVVESLGTPHSPPPEPHVTAATVTEDHLLILAGFATVDHSSVYGAALALPQLARRSAREADIGGAFMGGWVKTRVP